jgi:hypothetical protein
MDELVKPIDNCAQSCHFRQIAVDDDPKAATDLNGGHDRRQGIVKPTDEIRQYANSKGRPRQRQLDIDA